MILRIAKLVFGGETEGREASCRHSRRRVRRTGCGAKIEARAGRTDLDRPAKFSSFSATALSGGHRFAVSRRNCSSVAWCSEPSEKHLRTHGRGRGRRPARKTGYLERRCCVRLRLSHGGHGN